MNIKMSKRYNKKPKAMQRFNSSTEPWLRFFQTTPKAWLIPPGNETQSLASTSLLKGKQELF